MACTTVVSALAPPALVPCQPRAMRRATLLLLLAHAAAPARAGYPLPADGRDTPLNSTQGVALLSAATHTAPFYQLILHFVTQARAACCCMPAACAAQAAPLRRACEGEPSFLQRCDGGHDAECVGRVRPEGAHGARAGAFCVLHAGERVQRRLRARRSHAQRRDAGCALRRRRRRHAAGVGAQAEMAALRLQLHCAMC